MNDRNITQDLRRHGKPPADPDTLETRARRYGPVAIAIGLIIFVGTIVESLMLADANEHGLYQTEPARLWGLMGFVAQVFLGGFFILGGLAEIYLRSVRERQRLDGVLLRRLALDAEERDKVMMGMVAAVPHQLAALTERFDALEAAVADVPNYGRGVIDGVQMRQEALGGEGAEGQHRA